MGVDLGLVGFALLSGGGFEDDAALGVDDAGEGPGFFGAVAEDGAEHFDDVLVGVLVIVEEDEVVEGGDFGLFDGGVSGTGCGGWWGDHGGSCAVGGVGSSTVRASTGEGVAAVGVASGGVAGGVEGEGLRVVERVRLVAVVSGGGG